jgi:hypothetical protein
VVTVGVDVTDTATVTMPAWAFHALGTTEVAEAVTESTGAPCAYWRGG